MAKINIILSETSGKVLLNGVDISDSCYKIELFAKVGEVPSVYLSMRGDIKVEGEGEVKLVLPDDRIFIVRR